jgi:hypothetical protein
MDDKMYCKISKEKEHTTVYKKYLCHPTTNNEDKYTNDIKIN